MELEPIPLFITNHYHISFEHRRIPDTVTNGIGDFYAHSIKKDKKNLAALTQIATFAALASPPWDSGHLILRKGRLRTLSSKSESRKFALQEDMATGMSAQGVYSSMVLVVLSLCIYVWAWASLRCLSLKEAMREPGLGISREVQTPMPFLI